MSKLKTKKMKHTSVQFSDFVWWIIRIGIIVAIIFGIVQFFSGSVVHVEFASDSLPKQFVGYKIANVTCIHNKNNNKIYNKDKQNFKKTKPNFEERTYEGFDFNTLYANYNMMKGIS